jgi:nucleotide-binding universal stress UspA family protein
MQAVVVPIVPAITIKRILYATDFSAASSAALPVVTAIARRYGAGVYVAHVRSPLPYTMATPEAVCVIESRHEREARVAMDQVLHSPEMQGLATSAIVETGDPAEELKRTVRDYDIDLAVLGTHGRTGLMRLLMGSIAEELFRSLNCPVLTVGPNCPRKIPVETLNPILYPTDLSPASRAAFPYVASLAVEYRAKIILFHTISARDAVSSIAMETATLARKEVQRMFSSEIDPRSDYEIVIDFGDATDRILDCAREYRAGLIAFGVRRAEEIITHLRETVAYRLVLNAGCPVLTCRSL